MSGLEWGLLGTAVALAVAAVILAWRPLRRFYREVEAERARELFSLQREYLEAKFFDAAVQSEKPRGLRWKECEWERDVEFARDKKNGRLLAFVGVNIYFEPVTGEAVDSAVNAPRTATAVFQFTGRRWQVGRVLFNMNPGEAIARFQSQIERVEMS
jgi:hypothetical protein